MRAAAAAPSAALRRRPAAARASPPRPAPPPHRAPSLTASRVPRAGGWLCRPQEVLPEAEQVADCSLDDSEYTLCVRQADVVERDEHSLTKAGTYTCAPRDFGAQFAIRRAILRRAIRRKFLSDAPSSPLRYALANVRCRRCDVFVGVKVTSLEVHAQTEAAQRHHAQVRTMP